MGEEIRLSDRLGELDSLMKKAIAENDFGEAKRIRREINKLMCEEADGGNFLDMYDPQFVEQWYNEGW